MHSRQASGRAAQASKYLHGDVFVLPDGMRQFEQRSAKVVQSWCKSAQ